MPFRNAKEYGKVAVLMGGRSAEREISLMSGKAVLDALRAKGVDAHSVDAAHDVIRTLQDGKFNRVFNILHGRGGEDGVMQGALSLLGIPYTGSGVLASALGMNKLRCKEVWKANGLPTPDFMVLRRKSDIEVAIQKLGLPLIVKPSSEGSSFGIAKVSNADEFDKAWREAENYDDSVLAERFIQGKEYTVGIVGREPLPPIRLETSRAIYDYHAKYESDTTRFHCPSGADKATETRYQELALQAFDSIGAKGWARIDIMVDLRGDPWLIEINTLPGMTDHSLIPMAAKAAGIEFEDLVMRILDSAATDLDEGELDGC